MEVLGYYNDHRLKDRFIKVEQQEDFTTPPKKQKLEDGDDDVDLSSSQTVPANGEEEPRVLLTTIISPVLTSEQQEQNPEDLDNELIISNIEAIPNTSRCPTPVLNESGNTTVLAQEDNFGAAAAEAEAFDNTNTVIASGGQQDGLQSLQTIDERIPSVSDPARTGKNGCNYNVPLPLLSENNRLLQDQVEYPPFNEISVEKCQWDLRECQVTLNRIDLDSDKPLLTSQHLIQKLQSMVACSGNQSRLHLQVPSEGRKCIVEIEADLLHHFLQPLSLDTADPNGVDSTSSGYSSSASNFVSSFQAKRKRPPRPNPTWSAMSKLMHQEKVTFSPEMFKCSKCKRRPKFFASQTSLFIHNVQFHSQSTANPTNSSNNAKSTVIPVKQLNSKTQCKICMKILGKRSITAHMRIHTGEKPHKCKDCEERFTTASGLLQHISYHHH